MSEDDSVKHEGKWTRRDLPSGGKIREADDMAGNGLRSRVIDIALNEVVEHLNTHYPKPEPDQWRAEWVAVSEDLKAARRELEWSRKDRDRLDEGVREANARADAVEAKVRELREQVQRSGSIVYTVEEQDIEAEGRRVEVVDTGRQFNIRIQGQPVNAIKSSTEAREKAQRHIEAAARCEAIARRIETDTAVDPVEAKAIELHQVAYGGRIGFGHATLNAQEMFRSLARYVLGQEADDE